MQAEKFYRNIQEKVEKLDFDSENTILEWNKQDVWSRIEQKQGKTKSPFVWWQAAAAIFVLGGSFLYFNQEKLKNNTDNQVGINSQVTISTQEKTISANISTQTIPRKYTAIPQNAVSIFSEKNSLNVLETAEKALSSPQSLPEKQDKIQTIEPVEVVSNRQAEPEKTIQETTFVPNQALLAIKVPSKRERIAILEIPDDDEQYNLPRKEKKNGFVARLTRRMSKLGKTQNEELPSINNRPNKVWAFVKESFKNETMNVDSTTK